MGLEHGGDAVGELAGAGLERGAVPLVLLAVGWRAVPADGDGEA